MELWINTEASLSRKYWSSSRRWLANQFYENHLTLYHWTGWKLATKIVKCQAFNNDMGVSSWYNNVFIISRKIVFCFLFPGLFTADQKVRSQAIHTRQNPNGQRRGYECPEERDYYPYWHPTEWKDIVVFAHNKSWCGYYQEESFNVKEKRK